ncbi:2-methylcitrate dehydratase PrpD [Paraburkholderia sp. HC6.4b]|uniref:MmgE/PrpD family protein n=1 Tax=unclassified Paraburkholderia TaxID=2615204 RepID=UPI001622AC9C|nr:MULTISPECIES: MmgE/PrpD family protein [unclassified Paraburkholderia]MBB5406360.1 2-methylcitrate dehydratase PrpD [Paraburkholderia sp. HC6.4b]MBB5448758.1 2-methylcitrate dehydratase PrpD [Paraburkholderia sp. Kb1A]
MTQNEAPDASRLFAEFVTTTRFEDLPAKAVASTKRSIFDTVGVMLAGGGPGANAQRIVQMLSRWGGTPSGTVIGHDVCLPAPQAAFANAAMAHQYDFDDVHDEAVAHPTSNSFAGALAAAEEIPGSTGRELLSSVLLGNEIVCRVGLAIKGSLYDYVWIWPAVVAIWGSTTASARVMGLNTQQLQSAYGLTLHQTGTTLECHHGPGSDVRGFRDGFGARNGVTASYMAKAGLRGDAAAFEGKYGFYGAFFRGEYDRERLIGGLGERYEAERISIKAWPSARETHATLQALIEVRERQNIDPASIEKVVLRVGETNLRFCEPGEARRRPTVRMDALCALPFCAGVALAHGSVPLAAFSDEGMVDSRVLALADRVTWQVDESLSEGTVEGGDVEVHLKNGQTYRHQVRHGIGHPDFPISDELLVRKFIDCAALAHRRPSDLKVRKFWDVVQNLENIQIDEFSAAIRSLTGT